MTPKQKREYQRAWFVTNTEKKKGYNRAWRAANREREKERQRAWRAANPEKKKEGDRAWRAANREKVQERERKVRGQIEPPTRPMPDNCECCNSPRGFKVLAEDHDHLTGRFRGWLCRRCNMGLGIFSDTLAGIHNAGAYLQRAEDRQ